MHHPALPADEVQRLAALHALGQLDTDAEERFDRYTRLIKRLMDVPIALISLVDSERQWFKSKQGLDVPETSRDISFCAHAILGDDVFVVEDASTDPRFSENPLVTGAPHIRFYAGCPLKTGDNRAVGTLCIIDREPRTVSEHDLRSLRDFAAMVANELQALDLPTTDPLSGLCNLEGLSTLIEKALAVRPSHSACLIVIDFDGYSAVKDAFGEAEGDRMLLEAKEIMLQIFGDAGLIARLGGDHFCAFLPDAVVERPGALISRLRAALEKRNKASGARYPITFSSAVVRYSPDQSLQGLLDEAHAKVREEKQARSQ